MGSEELDPEEVNRLLEESDSDDSAGMEMHRV